MPYFVYVKEFTMDNGDNAPFTLNNLYKLHSLDNKNWFFINDKDDIHHMPWPVKSGDFSLLEFFTKADERHLQTWFGEPILKS